MPAADHLGQYAEGWTKGDAAIIVGSLDDSYQLDDINVGMISKTAFSDYLAGFKDTVEGIRGKSNLNYRRALPNFHITSTYGDAMKLVLITLVAVVAKFYTP